jgi:hypothetical protein
VFGGLHDGVVQLIDPAAYNAAECGELGYASYRGSPALVAMSHDPWSNLLASTFVHLNEKVDCRFAIPRSACGPGIFVHW